MDRWAGVSWIVLLLLTVGCGTLVDPALGVPDKCLACRAVAGEIELGLANERPRNHLDLRHRLDSRGQREGKVIDYKVSELRVVELLDGLCAKFKSYTLREGDAGRGEWIKVETQNLPDLERRQADSYSKELVSYCGRLMETTDDELTSKIQKGTVKGGDVEPVLCVELSKHCKLPKREEMKEGVPTEILGGSDGEL